MLKKFIQQVSPQEPRQLAIRQAYKELEYPKKIANLPFGKEVLASSLAEQREWLLALIAALEQIKKEDDDSKTWHARWELRRLCQSLLKRKLPFTAEDMCIITAWGETLPMYKSIGGAALVKACETYLKANRPPYDSDVLAGMQSLAETMNCRDDSDVQRYGHKLTTLLGEAGLTSGPRLVACPLNEGDAWADAARSEIAVLELEAANAWNTLLYTCMGVQSSTPSTKWLVQARAERALVGEAAWRDALLRWLPLVDTPHAVDEESLLNVAETYRNQLREERRWAMVAVNGDVLKGLAWLCTDQDDAELARAISRLVKDAFRKLPGIGARLARVGNAGIWALGQMPGIHGVAQLAILKTRLRLPIIQKQIAAAFDRAAKRLNLAQSEIEELVVPTYGLGENGQPLGVRAEEFDDFRAEIRLDENEFVLRWYKAGSEKPLSSAPRVVKSAYPDEVKELSRAVKDLRGMLAAQKARLDGFFLAQKSWPLPLWRERYLDHPLVGLIARRLVWKFNRAGQTTAGIWWDGSLVGSDDQPIVWLDEQTTVELWHPLNADVEAVLAWRNWLQTHQVQQPFKQAHREVYLLTDAERHTRTYSTRFAAHIIKQHQFNALCAARGWKHQLRLMVDASYPAPHRILENWGLRAEYWVESVGNNYGIDTTDSGTYLYLATDQVRFYALGAGHLYAHATGGGYYGRTDDQPLPLEEIPPLVFSEIMRDVDLFVGVASVGNDPNWSDGGPDGQYQGYWHSYAFGDLSENAITRRQVLEGLLPRLKIAPRCRLEEKFLVVRGDLRTYKIHLGSGNIRMEPNDEYLCIVPKSAASSGGERIFLPFEGDQTLSVILSKAFLLANDKAIKDPTITRQIVK